jgi:hypothetical protein
LSERGGGGYELKDSGVPGRVIKTGSEVAGGG